MQRADARAARQQHTRSAKIAISPDSLIDTRAARQLEGEMVRLPKPFFLAPQPRARKTLPAGALLWAWEADPEYNEQAGEKWLILLPDKWNGQTQYSWRFDPCELVPGEQSASQAATTPPHSGRRCN